MVIKNTYNLIYKLINRITFYRFKKWLKTDIRKFKGTISTIVEYAEPVIYGTSLPPSWGGRFRTRQQTIKGFPELQAKQLTVGYIPKELKRIIRGM